MDSIPTNRVYNPSERIGQIYSTNKGEKFTIIDALDALNYTIQFEDGTIVKNIIYGNIISGRVKNYNSPSVLGVGYLGYGKYKSRVAGIKTKAYVSWMNMFVRSYSKKRPTYIGCSVDEKWHNFQNFAQWHENNYNPKTMQGWHLDKDILFKGNKIYSEDTCCFVPNEINVLFIKPTDKGNYPIGVTKERGELYRAQTMHNGKRYISLSTTPNDAFYAYKEVKEGQIKVVATIWRPLISEKVYQAMINYTVEITD